ncbi:uncharacterized protein LOC112575162 isoform X2 [Pomacea canaliculata]|nr:uncharacterized protein LOC112575162 isoform X2 [Pomacea canaliculata]
MVIVRAMLGGLSPHLYFSTSQYIFWMLIFLGPVCTQETKITCSIPSVPPLRDTVLICHFPEDLSVTKKDFTVYHYVQHDIPESVLDCWWIKGVLDCYTKPGFKFDRRVSQTLNTTIHNVTMANTGFYTCQVAGYSPDLLETCEFSLKPVSDSNIKCNLSSTTLMCLFNQDVQKTQKRFAVYRHNAKENQNVVDCSWEYGILYCNVEDGYFFDKEVSSYIQVEIPRKDTKGDAYTCWLEGSDADELAMCFLETESEENSVLPMAVGISLGLLLVIASSVIGIFIWRLRRRARKSEISQEDELQEMINKDKHPITQAFQDFQLKKVKDMYPDMLKGLYFVPPVYFNKIQYTTQSVAGQAIHIADSPDPSDVRHDQAMQHVLHCLRHMAQQQNMFVLTQFKYEDYLNNPGPDFAKHGLPTFSSLKKKFRDKDDGCFDILFIHRLHGVVAGVVKSVSDKNNDCEDGGGSVDDHLVTEVSDAIRQLNKAKNVLQHLLSDQEQITVRLILMLPNVAMSTLERALNSHTKVAQELHDCLHLNATDDSTQLCLCADHLSSPSVPWKVNSTVVNHLKQWWEGVTKAHANQPKMTTELFQDIVARFCGPATQSCLNFSVESKYYMLPKTLNQAISLTSHLFEQYILYPGMTDMLEEPRVFLSGPPGTGKTRMLALVGRKWMSEGHVVHLITSVETREATRALEKLLLQTPRSQSQTFPKSGISRLVCEIDDKKKRDESIEKLIGFAKLNPLFALIDELVLERWKETNVEAFLKSLRKTIPNLHLWTASCTQNITSPDWKTCILTEPLSCPPAVVRQIKRKPNTADIKENSPLKYLPPTDGLPVKIFSHKGRGHTGREPRDCDACGKNVVKFLTQSVQLTDTETEIIEMNTSTGTEQTTFGQCPALQYRDVLILFESNVTQDSPIVKALSNIRIPVQVIDFQKPSSTICMSSVLAARTSSLCTLRRKVVVYVEGAGNRSNISLQRGRQKGLTSCTSQLVFVKYNKN